MIGPINKLVKSHPSLLRPYFRARFFSNIPPRDFFAGHGIKLFLAVEPYTMLPYCRMAGIHEAALLLERGLRLDLAFLDYASVCVRKPRGEGKTEWVK